MRLNYGVVVMLNERVNDYTTPIFVHNAWCVSNSITSLASEPLESPCIFLVKNDFFLDNSAWNSL